MKTMPWVKDMRYDVEDIGHYADTESAHFAAKTHARFKGKNVKCSNTLPNGDSIERTYAPSGHYKEQRYCPPLHKYTDLNNGAWSR